MKDHFFISSCDGALHDTRQPDWHKTPLRANYKRSHREISSVADFKATLRAGQWAWPGGYPMYLLCSDGAALCFACASKEARQVMWSIVNRARDGWRVVACDINYEDTELHCSDCSKPIESAYGGD